MKKTRAVLIDDHALVREGLASLLRQLGLEVVGQGRSGEEAIALSERLLPELLVIDVSLEGMNGIEAARRITASGSGPAIVMVSMHRSAEVLARAFAAGARGYVLKDDDPGDLERAVRTVLRGEIFIAESLKRAAQGRTVLAGPEPRSLTQRENEVLALVAEGFRRRRSLRSSG